MTTTNTPAPATWCQTCGSPVENGKCACWCHLADTLQRYLGRDFDASADEAARLWDDLDDEDKARVWSAEYASDHDVETYPEPASAGVRVTIGDDPAWTFTAASVDAGRWNGWSCPWFTEAEARRVAAVSKADYDRDPEATQEYIEIREGSGPEQLFWLTAPEEDKPWPVTSRYFDGVWLYAVGAGNWTWEKAES